ncbi:TIGR02206 family membrane protein [candidate division KSB3 bacterium]|uniref:TIGR02206 family membrane protein n=1 Tax=candidate division KSB3 bacterium TaxID=2044937 RepID=A0A2G6K9Y0_9BACT|nr:MAG: TIGR02206 family membrane protein [candidate division KSB3 bacterium]
MRGRKKSLHSEPSDGPNNKSAIFRLTSITKDAHIFKKENVFLSTNTHPITDFMSDVFAVNYSGEPFHFFGPAHITVLTSIILFNVLFFLFRKRFSVKVRRNIRYGMAILLFLNEIGYHIWRISTGTWTIQHMLPLHLCAVLVWFSLVMLLTGSVRIYEFSYFLGIAGATQALLTPEVSQYGFPHYRWCQTFISHGILVAIPLYMTFVEGFRPYWKSVTRVLLTLNIYAVFVGIVNAMVGSNYLFIARKPDMPTLLDVLGPWPWYILAMEALALVLCLLLYLPFAIKDKKAR